MRFEDFWENYSELFEDYWEDYGELHASMCGVNIKQYRLPRRRIRYGLLYA